VHAVYFYTLAEAYRDGDLSLIYPISRSVPIFVLLRSVFVWHDPIIVPGILGILIVVGGAYTLQLRKTSLTDLAAPLRDIKRRRSTRLAWTTALLVATYSLIDDRGVGVVQPVLYLVVYGAVGLPAYTPVVLWRECSNLVSEWRASWRWIRPAGLISSGGYLFALLALRISYVGYVSSIRQISIVFGVILGERPTWRAVRPPLADRVCDHVHGHAGHRPFWVGARYAGRRSKTSLVQGISNCIVAVDSWVGR